MSSSKDLQRIDLSLDRIKDLLDRLGNPQHNLPVIHVAGTNGKGSTIHFLKSILSHVIGLNIATFTTPHLRTERDTCQVAGRSVDLATWQRASDEITRVQDTYGIQCTPFEALTAKAFYLFDALKGQDRPDILLVEVGVGGALDATNVFKAEQVLASVICAIDYDHQAILGTTLSQIASQKAGIVKMNGLCVIGDQSRASVRSYDRTREAQEITQTIKQICSEKRARTVWTSVAWQDFRDRNKVQLQSPQTWAAIVSSVVDLACVASADDNASEEEHKDSPAVDFGLAIRVPATQAAISASHLALQTLWAIARDGNACALGNASGDPSEHIRLKIAHAFRKDYAAQAALKDCIEQHANLEGRASWLRLTMSSGSEHVGDTVSEFLLLVDGAHNVAAAQALRSYIETCLVASGKNEVTLTWVIALSHGKPIEDLLEAFFGRTEVAIRQAGSQLLHLTVEDGKQETVKVKIRIAAVPFTTPVDGMPWVRCVPPADIASAAKKILSSGHDLDVQSFESLSGALKWAAEAGPGAPSQQGSDSSMIICAGSLYLVSDVFRMFQGRQI
jgi:folylpolyglutamate synthase